MLSVAPRAAGAGLGTGASTNNPKKIRSKSKAPRDVQNQIDGHTHEIETHLDTCVRNVQIAVAPQLYTVVASALSAERS